MSYLTVLAPLIVQVALTFVLLLWTARLRVGALRRGETRLADIALRQPNWPVRALQVGYCYQNQLELPILFYVLVILEMLTRQTSVLLLVLSWLFVLSRLVHAAIFVTSNNVRHRFYAYAIGALVLLLMWIVYVVDLYTGLP